MKFDLEFPFPIDVFSLPVEQALKQEPVQVPARCTAVNFDHDSNCFLVVTEEGIFEFASIELCKAVEIKPVVK